MKNLRWAVAMLVVTLVTTACTEKKADPPKPVEPPKPAVVVPPATPPEPLADKECAAPVDPGPAVELKFGARVGKQTGARLAFSDADADGSLTFGVLGPVNEDSGLNMLALKKFVKFFQDEKADAIIVTGDVGEVASGIARVLEELGSTQLPVFVVIGNRECRAEYTDGVTAAKAKFPNVVNLNEVRVVEFPELTLVSLPGYHDPNYINCRTGCQYLKSTVADVVRVAKEAKTPVALIAHGPPRGTSNQSLDFAGAGGNVGDEAITKAIVDGNISFGFFSNIKEAGGRATKNPEGSELLKEGEASKSLYLNPGPADTMGWDMNDSTKSVGMAAVFTFKDGAGSFKMLRLKPPTAAEKAEAKKLDPPAREEARDEKAQ
jgi:Icc-related predicted phosphoesterase/predicted component of type VI protein secretion system